MFTKEELSSMKYKELVVIAKQYGVYKSRSKKVNLLNKLLSIDFSQVVTDQLISANDKGDTTQKTDFFESTMSPAALRRETFDVVPCMFTGIEVRDDKTVENEFHNTEGEILDTDVPSIRRETFDMDKGILDTDVPSIRRETFDIDKGSRKSIVEDKLQIFDEKENLSSTKSEKSILRQNTFSIDKPKEKLSDETVAPATPSVLRQATFSIDKPNNNNIFEEMPGLVCKEIKNTIVKPFTVNHGSETTCSPVRTRNSIHRSLGSAKSIGQRIENQRTTRSERRPSSRGSKAQKNFSVNMVSVTPVRLHKTSVKGGRIEKKITPSKLPNFKAIHLREFSKMESIVEHTKRKEERTKALLTPLKLNPVAGNMSKGTSLAGSRIPVKFNLPATEASTSFTPSKGKLSLANYNQNNANLSKSCVSNVKDKLKFLDSPMTKVKRKSESGVVKDITNKMAPNPKKRVQNVKDIVSSKMHPFSVERNRAKGRDFLQSVRMNRRFQLQMEVMRKAKV